MRTLFLFRVLTAGLAPAGPLLAEPVACQLCAPGEVRAASDRERLPIRIEVEAALDFSRIARTGGEGAVSLDPVSGTRSVTGGVVDLGGMGLSGSVRVTGEPLAPVLVTLPNRVQLRSTNGELAEVVDIRSDLQGSPRLDMDGNLRFSFGGRLILRGNGAGVFRGNIPISVDYP